MASKKFGEESEKINIRVPRSKKREVLNRVENEILVDYTTEKYKEKLKLKSK